MNDETETTRTSERVTVAATLRDHLWSDTPGRTCGCGWLAESAWMVDPTQPNRVEQWLDHVAGEVERIIAARVAQAKAEAWDEAVWRFRHEAADYCSRAGLACLDEPPNPYRNRPGSEPAE